MHSPGHWDARPASLRPPPPSPPSLHPLTPGVTHWHSDFNDAPPTIEVGPPCLRA